MSPRLIIVSNRVVAPEEADSSLADELAATVKAALKNQSGMWLGWSGKMTRQPGSEPRTLEVNKVTYVQIDLSNNDIQEYCNGLANSVLWPILHYRVDLQEYSRADASGYVRVNQLFADHLSALINEDDVIWVHDYHLMVLARELRSRGHRNRIGFFLHTPCAPPDILQTLPHHRKILGGLTYCDLVGFQTENDRDNFAQYLVSQGGTRTRGGYEIDGRQVRVGVFPVSIETKAYMRLARNAGRSAMVALVREKSRRKPACAQRRSAGLFEGHSATDQGVRAIPGDESGVARQGDAGAAHAEELVRHQAIQRDRVRGGRPDRQGQRAIRRCSVDPDPLCQSVLFAHCARWNLSRRQRCDDHPIA